MAKRQPFLTAVCEELCDATKYPAYARFHDILRSLEATPTWRHILAASYTVDGQTISFYVVFSNTTNFGVSMTEVGPRDEIAKWGIRCESGLVTCYDDVLKYPARVIEFLYAMRDAGVDVYVRVNERMK